MTTSYSQMIKYEIGAVEGTLPTMSDWEFEDSEGPSCPICGFRSALAESLVIGLGTQYCSQHMLNSTHNDSGFHSHLYNPNSTQRFPEPQNMPYPYQINQILQSSSSSTPYGQYEDYKMPPHPISPVSEYGPITTSKLRPVDVEEGYIRLPGSLDRGQQIQNDPSKEAYFPPNDFILPPSSSIPSFLSISFDSPISTPYQSPTKHEEEEYLESGTTEAYAQDMVTEKRPTIDDFMSQDTEIDEDPQDLDLEEMGDNINLQEDSQTPQKCTESELHNFGEQVADVTSIVPNIYSDTDTDKTAPYAVLIHRALMSSPEKKMVLADIYDYFREKIPRFKRVKGRGWMNSIRHNLSMNGAFLKQDRPPDDPGKGYIWVLSDEAIKGGVKSTTRYRKSPPGSKKRTADEMFLRNGAGKRRRKSTRKWATQAVRNCSGGEQALREETAAPQTPVFHYENVASPGGGDEPMIDYGLPSEQHPNIHNALNHDCFEPITVKDYPNCYASFPHPGMSSRLYIPESDDDLCFEGPHGFGNQFRDQYALVTDSQITGCQSTN